MNLLLIYLLAGFVYRWVQTQFFGVPCDKYWRWELTSIVLWPLTIAFAALLGRAE